MCESPLKDSQWAANCWPMSVAVDSGLRCNGDNFFANSNPQQKVPFSFFFLPEKPLPSCSEASGKQKIK